MSARSKLSNATTRELSHEEVAFLAWYFVAAARSPYGTSGEFPDGLAMQKEWEEHTGQELPDDFLNQVIGIHATQ